MEDTHEAAENRLVNNQGRMDVVKPNSWMMSKRSQKLLSVQNCKIIVDKVFGLGKRRELTYLIAPSLPPPGGIQEFSISC